MKADLRAEEVATPETALQIWCQSTAHCAIKLPKMSKGCKREVEQRVADIPQHVKTSQMPQVHPVHGSLWNNLVELDLRGLALR